MLFAALLAWLFVGAAHGAYLPGVLPHDYLTNENVTLLVRPRVFCRVFFPFLTLSAQGEPGALVFHAHPVLVLLAARVSAAAP